MSDFGLTKEVFTNIEGAKLPVKWTAPEALRENVSCNIYTIHECIILFEGGGGMEWVTTLRSLLLVGTKFMYIFLWVLNLVD